MGEHDFEGAGVGGAGEHVVGLFDLVQVETVGDELSWVDLMAPEQLEQSRDRERVGEAGGDGDISVPQALEMQGGSLTVDTDVGHVATGADEFGGKFKRGGYADCFDGDVGAKTIGELPDGVDCVLAAVVDQDVSAELLCCFEAGIGLVDGDDMAGAVELSGHDRGEPDGP